MALFTPSESPAVVVKEVDLTSGVPNVQTSTGAIVGNFRWGPAAEVTSISNEAELVDTFASPDSGNSVDFHSAAYFLRYSNSLNVVREVTSAAKNAHVVSGGAAVTIKNKAAFDGTTLTAQQQIIGRYPGALGNSLRFSLCPHSTSDSAFTNWTYKSSFDAAPGTSSYDSNRDGVNSEVHAIVVDNDGLFTGTAGTVLETYPFVSVANNSKNEDGTTNYIKDVINDRSDYIYFAGFDSAYAGANAGSALTPGTTVTFNAAMTATNYDLVDGVNSASLGHAEFATGHDLFEDKDTVEVDFLIAPGMSSESNQTTVVNDLIANATARKDCVVVTSPNRDAIVGQTDADTINSAVISTANTFTNSSYLFADNNYLKVYDKYNDQYINIPAASSTAGLMAETDRVAAPWFSPAGQRRGQYLGVTALNYNPTKTQRDALYKASVNPVMSMPGGGITLFGDKTGLNRPSAFDRINVRRLFLVLERAISRAAQNVMFEFNDEFTRAEFVNVIEPVLRDVKGRRGITDFRIVADETVNTAAVIDRNEFIANIFIKPARSINYVTLNFVAVRTGVDFEEVVGTV
jgi:phage tail sheath protein FI